MSSPSPFLGECADYPEGVYEYGQLGIGTCLAGPTDFQLLSDNKTLALSNANPWNDFSGGSVLFLDLEAVLASTEARIPVHTVGKAIATPSFNAAMALDTSREQLLVTNRLSDGRTREVPDDVWFLDVADPEAPELMDFDGSATVEVGYDPNSVAVSGDQAYVLNRTEHTVSILNLASSPPAVIPLGGSGSIEASAFEDRDVTGSRAAFSRLELLGEEEGSEARDRHDWTLSWNIGTVRAWVSSGSGAYRLSSAGEGDWEASNVSLEVDTNDTSGILTGVIDPAFALDFSAVAHLFFEEPSGGIWQAVTTDYLADWNFLSTPVLESGDWDTQVQSPHAVLDADGVFYLFYTGIREDGTTGIGLATSADGVSFSRLVDAPVLSLDGEEISDPFVIYDGQSGLWRMFFTRTPITGDPVIGQAQSPDLLSWELLDADFAPTTGASKPAVGYYNGLFHLYYTVGLEIYEASSIDAFSWATAGVAFALPEEGSIALQVYSSNSFRVEDEGGDVLGAALVPGDYLGDTTSGWLAEVVTGYSVGTEDGGNKTASGIQVDTVIGELSWLTATDASGVTRILVGVEENGSILPAQSAIEPKAGSFYSEAAFNAVVTQTSSGYTMFFAGLSDGVTRIGRATSLDGFAWTVESSPVLSSTDTWDSVALVPGSVEVEGETVRLWFAGFDGQQYRIGLASGSLSGVFTRVPGARYDWVFDAGAPGEWHDSGVRDPYVITVDGVQQLWFAGSDGNIWQLGHATRKSDSEDWVVAEDVEGTPRPVIVAASGSFGSDGLLRPVVSQTESGWAMYLTGLDSGSYRSGEAIAVEPDRWHRIFNQPSLADRLAFSSIPASDVQAIPLDVDLDSGELLAKGCSDLLVDEIRGFLYIPCKEVPEMLVVDIRDDSTPTWPDTNYLDVEAVVVLETSSTELSAGWRSAYLDNTRNWLWGLGDAPEALQAIDLNDIPDDGETELIRRPFAAMLALPRGGERDQGVSTQAWVGPGQVAMHPDGRHLFVSNFNDNSISVFDMQVGAYGTLVGEAMDLGENPYAISFTSDGLYAVVACYAGEVTESEGGASGSSVSSTLVILNADPESPDFLRPLSWVVNQ